MYFDYAYFRSRPASPIRTVLVAVCGTTGMRFVVAPADKTSRNPQTVALIQQGLRSLGLWEKRLCSEEMVSMLCRSYSRMWRTHGEEEPLWNKDLEVIANLTGELSEA